VRPTRAAAAVALVGALAGLACHGKDAEARPDAGPDAAGVSPAVSVPVRVAAVARKTFAETVTATGKTASLAQQKIKAPFAGTLTELSVTDGDAVRAGQTLGTIVSRDSEAALNGAREMARQARTDTETVDGARAVALAEHGLVRAPIVAPSTGTVVAHSAVRGDRVAEDQEILTVADSASFVFIADVPQSDLTRIRPGQAATVELAGRGERVSGSVHDVLPGANAADYTVPVRVDLTGLTAAPPIGLFGTARIIVAEHRNVAAVPEAALIRDDVRGTVRLAMVQQGHAHWLDVSPGLRSEGVVEITAPVLEPGQVVVVAGQVGLAEGTPVTSAAATPAP
jgi:multidrug efflux pump subunit AcrA (membrane-fusion protein)